VFLMRRAASSAISIEISAIRRILSVPQLGLIAILAKLKTFGCLSAEIGGPVIHW
jgi:hypothetical protein